MTNTRMEPWPQNPRMGMARSVLVGPSHDMEEGMDLALRCRRCGDVIGTYEPMIVLENGNARETSKAADPKAASEWSEHYHRDCYIADQPAGDVHA